MMIPNCGTSEIQIPVGYSKPMSRGGSFWVEQERRTYTI
jgi:hypothetical protein